MTKQSKSKLVQSTLLTNQVSVSGKGMGPCWRRIVGATYKPASPVGLLLLLTAALSRAWPGLLPGSNLVRGQVTERCNGTAILVNTTPVQPCDVL